MIMKHLKFYIVALLSLVASPGLVHAQDSSVLPPGKVQAFIVVGDVELVAADGTSAPLKRGQTFEEGNIVKAGAGAQALLVFSNGATMKVLQNCQLSVDEFKQAPFDDQAEGTFLRLSKDPSKSTTSLDLRNGTLQGEVKQLNQAAGSTFTVKTPAGSAGVRGTIISMSVVRNAAGQVIGITCNCVVGNMAFTPSSAVTSGTNAAAAGTTQTVTNTNVAVGTGASLVVTLTVDPTTGAITGGGISGTALATATAQAMADAVVETVNQAKADNNIAPQPPPTINVTAAPVVTTTNSNGTTTTSTVVQNTNATLSSPTPDTQTSGTATIAASPVTVVTTTTTTTGTTTTTTVTPPLPPPPTNPSTSSSGGST
jgi:hypothetical protein